MTYFTTKKEDHGCGQRRSHKFLLSCLRGILEENMQTPVTTSPLFPRDLQFKVCN